MLDVKRMEKSYSIFDKIYLEYKSKDQSEMIELDNTRFEQLPELKTIIEDFLGKKIDLASFKTTLDSALKRNRGIWGFSGFSGQMFFNMLFNSADDIDKLTQVLIASIKIPKIIEEAKEKIILFEKFVLEIQEIVEVRSKAPNTGHIPFFLSFLWQIQDIETFPTYYKKSIEKLEELGGLENLWEKEIDECYEQFYLVTFEYKSYIESTQKTNLTLYDIEHMFYHYDEEKTEKAIATISKEKSRFESLDELEFVGPYFKDLEQLSRSAERKDVKIFEEKISKLLEVIGFRVKSLGQGSGREPDGLAFADREKYCIIFDAKCRSNYYTFGTDDRAIIEYIKKYKYDYGIQYDRFYFMIVSSEFKDNEIDKIKLIKKNSAVHSVVMITASNLLKLLNQKIKQNLKLNYLETNFLMMIDGIIPNDMFHE